MQSLIQATKHFLIKLVKIFLEKNLKDKGLGLFNNQNLIGKKLLGYIKINV
jgi:hypothetical protein